MGEGAGEAVGKGIWLAVGAEIGVAAGVAAGGGRVGSGVSAQAASASTSSTARPSRRSRFKVARLGRLPSRATQRVPSSAFENPAEPSLDPPGLRLCPLITSHFVLVLSGQSLEVVFGQLLSISRFMTGDLPDLLRARVSGVFCIFQGEGSSKNRLYRFCPPFASFQATET